MHVIRYPRKLQFDHVVFHGCGMECPSMPKVLSNNKLSIPFKRAVLVRYSLKIQFRSYHLIFVGFHQAYPNELRNKSAKWILKKIWSIKVLNAAL